MKNLIGFNALPHIAAERNVEANIEGTEAYMRFKRVWGDVASEKFFGYCSLPLIHPSAEATREAEQWLNTNRRFPHKRLIAVSPYSNWPSKDIPDETVVSLIQDLTTAANAEIVLVGGRKDYERSAKLLNASSGPQRVRRVFRAGIYCALEGVELSHLRRQRPHASCGGGGRSLAGGI